MSDAEHRRDPRVTRQFMVRYRSASAGSGTWMLSPLHDLSASGARFVSEHPFAFGDHLDLQLVLPVSTQPVGLAAKVVWVKPAPLNLTEIGVAFEPASEETRQMIRDAVAHFLRQPRSPS